MQNFVNYAKIHKLVFKLVTYFDRVILARVNPSPNLKVATYPCNL